ncbi:LysR substrate-binding domain-containing protein [Streptomyces sp. M19]
MLHIPALLADFLAEHPGLDIQLRQSGSAELIELVRTGRLDLAFVARPARCPVGVVAEPLSGEPLVLACAPGHPLAGRADVAPPSWARNGSSTFRPAGDARPGRQRARPGGCPAPHRAGGHRRPLAAGPDRLRPRGRAGPGLVRGQDGPGPLRALADPVPMWEVATVTGDRPSAAAALLREVRTVARRAADGRPTGVGGPPRSGRSGWTGAGVIAFRAGPPGARVRRQGGGRPRAASGAEQAVPFDDGPSVRPRRVTHEELRHARSSAHALTA